MKIKLNFFLAPNQTERILDIFTPTEVVDEVNIFQNIHNINYEAIVHIVIFHHLLHYHSKV